MSPRVLVWSVPLTLLAVVLAGCGARQVAGGTAGLLRAAGDPLSEVQVTVHQLQDSSWQPVGFAVTTTDGTFELVSNGAAGTLWLSQGDYRCTLESVGAPVVIPAEYAQPETTPFTFSWSPADSRIDLEIPAALVSL